MKLYDALIIVNQIPASVCCTKEEEQALSKVIDAAIKFYAEQIPDNPLTLEELRGRIGKPVFIIDGNVRTWTILESMNSDFAHFVESSKCSVRLPIEGINEVWIPYAREPVSK